MKQIIEIKQNGVKNPKLPPEANQLVIYKHSGGFVLGTTVNKSSQRSARAGLELGASELRVQRPNRPAR